MSEPKIVGARCLISWCAALGLALASVGCSSDASPAASTAGSGGAAGAANSASAGGGSTGSSGAVVGGFAVELEPLNGDTPPFTNVSGEVFDGPSPATLVWKKETESGGCQLRVPEVPFCDPGCGGSAVCVADGMCQSYPSPQDLGKVAVSGLGDPFSMAPVAATYQTSLTTPYPAAAEGAPVTISVASSPFGAFEISTPMVAPLVVPAASLELARGSALSLAWQAPGASASSRMGVKVDISHHGGSKGEILCDVPDNGTLEISAALVSALIDRGVAGYPNVTLTRSTSGSTTITPGAVTLQALSAVTVSLNVAGVTSCSTDADCPTAKPCQSDQTCTK